MGSAKDHIPAKDNVFYPWQGNFVNLVVLNAVAWSIPPADVMALSARRAEYEPLYIKAQNKTTRNRTDVLNHREMRETYEKEIRSFVKKYCDTLPNSDKSDLGLTIPDTEPTPRGKIDVYPYVYLKAIGGGDIEIRCRVEEDKTMASMHPLADGVECKYILVPKGEMPPESQKDAKTAQVSKKARFTVSCGDEKSGDSFWGFFRWVNLTNPANSGPWTKSIKVVVA
jgi:hypothetical protein